MTQQEYEFLKEYEKLCKKYNMYIGGCGCCGSPWLHGNSGRDINYVRFEYTGITIDDIDLDTYYEQERSIN